MVGTQGWKRIGITSIWVGIATFSSAFTQWAIMAIIARQDGPSALGAYALVQAFATPAGYFAWLNLRGQYVIGRLNVDDWNDAIYLRSTFPLLVFGVTLFGVAIIYDDTSLSRLGLGVLIYKYVEGFFDLSYGRLQQDRRPGALGLSSLFRTIVTLPVFYVAYILSNDCMTALIWISFANTLTYLIYSVVLQQQFSFSKVFGSFSESQSRRFGLAIRLFPYALATVLMALTTSAPRLLLEPYVGQIELGHFAAVAHFIAIGAVAVGSIGHALAPSFVGAFSRFQKKTFWSLLFWPSLVLQVAALGGVLVSYFVGDWLVELIYGPEFADNGYLVLWAAVAAGPVYIASIAGVACYSLQLRALYFFAQAAGLLVLFVLIYILLPHLGVVAGFAAMAMCSIFQLCLFFIIFVVTWAKNIQGADLSFSK